MAAPILFHYRNRRLFRRNRVFRDRTHPLEVFNDYQVLRKFRFPRQYILEVTDELRDVLEHPVARQGSLTPVLQVCLALRFYATGATQDVVGEMIGVSQSTASRTIARVTNALHQQVRDHIFIPSQEEANQQKRKFYQQRNFPDVVGCVDGTHVRITAPSDGHEADYVNRKNFHSINVQVICDADLIFINVIARWPGSVHDARILRTSALFRDFESHQPPVQGVILGDSAYMLRSWLMTPLLHPTTPAERRYNFAHSSTRTTVERSIGVTKQRWRCLRVGLDLVPEKASKVIMVCFMLHNKARRLRLPLPDLDSDDEDDEDAVPVPHLPQNNPNERARVALGQAVRRRIIENNFRP